MFFTGKGDRGTSGFNGKKMKKDDVLFEALGALDRVNAHLGWCAVEAKGSKKERTIYNDLSAMQEMLFIAQAEVAALGFGMQSNVRIRAAHTKVLEAMIVRADAKIPKLTQFVLPGGSELAARIDSVRTITRDAERALLRVHARTKCAPELLAFMNRLSSVLFAEARLANVAARVKERHPSY